MFIEVLFVIVKTGNTQYIQQLEYDKINGDRPLSIRLYYYIANKIKFQQYSCNYIRYKRIIYSPFFSIKCKIFTCKKVWNE